MTKARLLSTLSLLLATPLLGQAPPPGAVQQQSHTVQPGSTSIDSSTLPAMSDRVFDTSSDSIDPNEGTLNWKGRTFNIGDNRAVRSRFERYLATPQMTMDEEQYQEVLAELMQKLSLIDGNFEAKTRDQAKDDLFEAWKLLFVAGQYPQDNGNSLLVANLVNNAWRVKNETERSQLAGKELERQKKRLRERMLDQMEVAEFWQKKTAEKVAESAEEGEAENTGAAASATATSGAQEVAFTTEDLTALQARIASLNTETASSGYQLKLQYQSNLVQLLTQRRFQQTIIAASFYRHIFKASHQGLEVGKDQLAEFLPGSNLQPTVDLMEFVAKEALQDVQTGMAAVNNLYDNRELYAATQRLQETFFLGEYTGEVLLFEPEAKAEIYQLVRSGRELQRQVDFKNYEAAQDELDTISSLATDFPSGAAQTVIDTAMRISDMHLLKAQTAMAKEDFEKAEAAMAKAAEIWPLNPKIKKFGELADDGMQGTLVFDDLFKQGDYRKIFDDRKRFIKALIHDPDRQVQLDQAIEKVINIDTRLRGAEEMIRQDNINAAWELVVEAKEIYDMDTKLLHMMSELGPKAADFAGALMKAESAEDEGKSALALNHYLKARELHPISRYAREGIERNAGSLLDELAAKR